MASGVSTANITSATTITEVVGNQRLDANNVQTVRVPIDAVANQMVGDGPIADEIATLRAERAAGDVAVEAKITANNLGATQATNAEAVTGTNTAHWMSPAQDKAALDARVSPIEAKLQASDAWKGSVEVVDGSGNLLVEVTPTTINHPDTNAMRAKLGDNSPSYDTKASWRPGLIIEDPTGARLLEVSPDKIDHPDQNTVRAAVTDHGTRISTLESAVASLNPGDLGTLYASVAQLVSAKSRHPNRVVILGDSRMAQHYVTTNRMTNYSAFGWANALLGKRMSIAGFYAVSGQLSDQYLSAANLTAAIGTNALWAFMFGIVNDLAQYGAGDYFAAVVKPACETLIGSGMRPVIFTECGAHNLTTAAIRGSIAAYNQKLRQYARTRSGVVLFDLAAVTLDPTSQYLMKTGYNYENGTDSGVHFTTLAACNQGLVLAEILRPLIPPVPLHISTLADQAANGQVQVGNNPLFLTTTGGTAGSGVTGSVPTGLTLACDTGVTCTVSTEAGPFGNDLVLAMTATQAGQVRGTMNMPSGYDSPGDQFEAAAQFQISAGHSNYAGPMLYFESRRGGVSVTNLDFWNSWDAGGAYGADHGPIAPGAMTLDLLSNPLTIPTGTWEWFTHTFKHTFIAAGSATVRVRCPSVRKLQTI